MISVTLKKMINVRIFRASPLSQCFTWQKEHVFIMRVQYTVREEGCRSGVKGGRSQPFLGLMRFPIQQNDWAWRAGESNGGLLVLLIPVGTEHELQLHRINTDCDNVQDLLTQQERQLKSCISREKQHITEILQWLADVYVQNLSHVALYSDQQQWQWSGVCHHFL